jgi:hypothetical protein
MVYALHKFHHYLLGDKFVFYVNHMTFLHLTNKPYIFGRIARWVLVFFVIWFSSHLQTWMFPFNCKHIVKLPSNTKNLRILYQMANVTLFVM